LGITAAIAGGYGSRKLGEALAVTVLASAAMVAGDAG
jgi:hypothetical protein